MNILGDYRLSTACNVSRWALPPGSKSGVRVLQNEDFGTSYTEINEFSIPQILNTYTGGDLGSQCYASAISLETSNGIEISGLNAEEQSDISFLANWFGPQVSSSVSPTPTALECYVYYDAMIVLEENNVVKLIQ